MVGIWFALRDRAAARLSLYSGLVCVPPAAQIEGKVTKTPERLSSRRTSVRYRAWER